ncbi:MAG: hypothetical protein ACI8QZ_001808 [Chlamydiales bacterium]|jgi:hypothetical protein
MIVLSGFLAACSGSSGGGVGDGDFRVQDISVDANQVWQVNRPIEVTFTEDVDFSTVSLNTIQIADLSGRPASGSFSLAAHSDGSPDPRRVRFQPSCPTLDDNSDAGLLPGGAFYTLFVVGSTNQGISVRSSAGAPLEQGRSVTFQTPNSTDPQEIFLDPVPGAPSVRLRGSGSIAVDEVSATYLELGGDPANRVYFQLAANQFGELPRDAMGNPFPVPLNPYSVPTEGVAVVLYLNQPVDATTSNINGRRVRFEYNDPRIADQNAQWVTVATDVELVSNCIDTGSVLRLTPVGVLPQGANMRVNLGAEFADLAGNAGFTDRSNFALMTTTLVDNVGAADPTSDADEILETFLVGGSVDGSIEDVETPITTPRASWEGGKLTASFAFEGSGGSFDWIVAPGAQVVVNTVSGEITGGDGAATGTQSVVNGLIDVRNIRIFPGAQVVFQGPNPVKILASGSVIIEGELVASGDSSDGVVSLDTTNEAEPGAIGQAGGGNGGTGSFLTSQSTSRGGNGFGAFGLPNGGGRGGETGFHPTAKDDRRGAGGGGGRLGPDILHLRPIQGAPTDMRFVQTQTLIGMDAEPGFGGGPLGTGAVSQNDRAVGGDMGPFPFTDGDDDNNFYGSMLRLDPVSMEQVLVAGELTGISAGSGGGAGGDAVTSNSFPLVPFEETGDEKGAGGGGGGGSISITAVGDITLPEGGRITANGGRGAGGENTNFQDHVGGGSGGGSGGHILLASAGQISITSAAAATGPFYRDSNSTDNHPARALSALGGQGGVGMDDVGGGRPAGPTSWRCDGIPLDRLELAFPGGLSIDVPPVGQDCFDDLGGIPNGSIPGTGGDGGPGLIQLHVDSPATNLLFPAQQTAGQIYGVDLDVTRSMAPPPVGWSDFDRADILLPFFGATSVAQSRWIRIGLGRLNPDPAAPGNFLADRQVSLRFAGTDAAGDVEHTGVDIDLLNPVIGPDPLGASPALPFIDPASSGATMVLDASGLAGGDDIYKRNPALNQQLVLRLVDSANAANEQRFQVLSGQYDAINDQLRVTVSTAGGSLLGFVAAGTTQVSYVPTFFRVATAGLSDQLAAGTGVTVTFDATLQDLVGDPDPTLAYSEQDDGMGMGDVLGFTGEITDLNAQNWDFVRFRVLFDLNAGGGSLDPDTAQPSLDHLRIQLDY